MNEQNFVDDCIKCNAIDEKNFVFFNAFFFCKRLIDVENDVCECCLYRHREQKCSINEQSIKMSIVQTFIRSRVSFVAFSKKSRTRMRSTTKTFEFQINMTSYLFVRSTNKNNSTTIKNSTIENSSFTFVHNNEHFFSIQKMTIFQHEFHHQRLITCQSKKMLRRNQINQLVLSMNLFILMNQFSKTMNQNLKATMLLLVCVTIQLEPALESPQNLPIPSRERLARTTKSTAWQGGDWVDHAKKSTRSTRTSQGDRGDRGDLR